MAAALAATACFALTSCARIDSGTVEGKRHGAAHSRYLPEIRELVPEKWILTIRDDAGRLAWIDVTPDEYERYSVGQRYP